MTASIGFIGPGRLGATLATALHQSGMPVSMIASRTPASAQHVADTLSGCQAVTMAQAATADVVFITVPDDAIADVANQLTWRAGQSVVHCSGATDVAVLAHAAQAGALIGGFHPMQIFSGAPQSVALLEGASVGIEGPPALEKQLREIAAVLHMVPMLLPPGARALYHGGSLFMSSFLLSMFKESAALWGAFGMSEQQTLQALLPLARGVIETAHSRGIAASLAGPISRGDAGVVARHIAAFDQVGQEHSDFYRAFSQRQLALAAENGKLTPAQLTQLAQTLQS